MLESHKTVYDVCTVLGILVEILNGLHLYFDRSSELNEPLKLFLIPSASTSRRENPPPCHHRSSVKMFFSS